MLEPYMLKTYLGKKESQRPRSGSLRSHAPGSQQASKKKVRKDKQDKREKMEKKRMHRRSQTTSNYSVNFTNGHEKMHQDGTKNNPKP